MRKEIFVQHQLRRYKHEEEKKRKAHIIWLRGARPYVKSLLERTIGP